MPARVARAVAVIAAGTLLTLGACADRDAASITGIRRAPAHLEETLDGQISAMIAAIFPPREGNPIATMWSGAKKKAQLNDPRAGSSLLDVVALIRKATPKIIPPPSLTQDAAAAQLVLLMSLYVHAGPATQPPPALTPESDAKLALVLPTEAQTVQTPSHQAVVVFAQGAVSQPTIVVISKEDRHFDEECSGPLPTTRCQYPQFYQFDVFPDVRLNIPALVAVCHVTAGDHRTARADHERFRLAHQTPTDPAAYHPEGTIEGDIEILPLVSVGDLTSCEDTEYHDHAMLPPGAGLLERLAFRTKSQLRRAAHALGTLVTPKSLYAIDRGGGGSVFMFSDFAVIDPQSQADLSVPGPFTASLSSVVRGQPVTVDAFDITNDGTGPAGRFVNQILLASNASLSEDVVALATLPTGGLNPEVVLRVASTVVTIPVGTAPGTYWLGVQVDGALTVTELDEENNVRSVQITVTDPIVTENALTAGHNYHCALNPSGQAFCWGVNTGGQLGNGTTTNSNVPSPVSQGDLTFKQISAASSHTCAVTPGGDIYCWGQNGSGQLGNGTTEQSLVPVRVSGERAYQYVAVGGSFTCALSATGSPYCWGINNSGQLGIGTSQEPASVSTPRAVAGELTFTRLSAGLWTACGVTASHQGYCWGNNGSGNVGNGSTAGTVPAPALLAGNHSWNDVQAGGASACGSTNEGSYCWGFNFFGAVGNGSTAGAGTRTPTLVVGEIDLERVWSAVGNTVFDPSCGLTGNGTAYCWGANQVGQLGVRETPATCTFTAVGEFGCSGTPLPVETDLRFLTLRIGADHVCGITTARDYVCWGRNIEGQLGNGGTANSNTPVIVSGGLKAP
jgi:alpha-tubulin suppressor-like RCC1 family protein